MSQTDVSPSDAVRESEISGPVEEPDASESDKGGTSIVDMLLSTEPAESPDEYSADETVAHVVIGIKKMLRGAGMSVKAGVPALQNFAMAGIGFMQNSADKPAPEESDESDDQNTGLVDTGDL